RLSEPAADLAVAAALISSRAGVATPAETVYFGEVSLSGAVRPVAQAAMRLREAEKLGFVHAVVPAGGSDDAPDSLSLQRISALDDLVAAIAAESAGLRSSRRLR